MCKFNKKKLKPLNIRIKKSNISGILMKKKKNIEKLTENLKLFVNFAKIV